MCLHHNSARKRTSARATLARFAERQSLNPLRHQYVRGPAEPNACPLDERRCGVPHTNSGKRPFEIKTAFAQRGIQHWIGEPMLSSKCLNPMPYDDGGSDRHLTMLCLLSRLRNRLTMSTERHRCKSSSVPSMAGVDVKLPLQIATAMRMSHGEASTHR